MDSFVNLQTVQYLWNIAHSSFVACADFCVRSNVRSYSVPRGWSVQGEREGRSSRLSYSLVPVSLVPVKRSITTVSELASAFGISMLHVWINFVLTLVMYVHELGYSSIHLLGKHKEDIIIYMVLWYYGINLLCALWASLCNPKIKWSQVCSCQDTSVPWPQLGLLLVNVMIHERYRSTTTVSFEHAIATTEMIRCTIVRR